MLARWKAFIIWEQVEKFDTRGRLVRWLSTTEEVSEKYWEMSTNLDIVSGYKCSSYFSSNFKMLQSRRTRDWPRKGNGDMVKGYISYVARTWIQHDIVHTWRHGHTKDMMLWRYGFWCVSCLICVRYDAWIRYRTLVYSCFLGHNKGLTKGNGEVVKGYKLCCTDINTTPHSQTWWWHRHTKDTMIWRDSFWCVVSCPIHALHDAWMWYCTLMYSC